MKYLIISDIHANIEAFEAVMDAAGAWDKDVSTVEGDGTFGAIYGMMRALSGSFDTTLVVAHVKGSEGNMNLITNGMFDPILVHDCHVAHTKEGQVFEQLVAQGAGADHQHSGVFKPFLIPPFNGFKPRESPLGKVQGRGGRIIHGRDIFGRR